MQEIKCPNCGEVFQVDESSYDSIVKQVRDKEFSKEIEERENHYAKEKDTAIKLAQAETTEQLNKELSKKDAEIIALQAKLKSEEDNKKAAVVEAVATKEKELSANREEILKLKSKIDSLEAEKKLAINEAVNEKEKEISEQKEKIALLNGQIETNEKTAQLKEQTLKENYEEKLKGKDEQIAYYKDLKAKQSTKMVGETLEQHCEIEFNKLRATGFQNAYFEKDNDAKSGSKGDFIFKEFSDDGTEFISIMFEMKNEMDETATKHKNEDFFKELDKDRNEKKCEYAVLVSLLEAESDLYNQGIVDVSYLYPKTYVIRPQFFIPIISLLRNASLNSLESKRELQKIKNQNIDIANFKDNFEEFKKGFTYNCDQSDRRIEGAIDEICKAIRRLESAKTALEASKKQLKIANEKTVNMTVEKLCKNSDSLLSQLTDK